MNEILLKRNSANPVSPTDDRRGGLLRWGWVPVCLHACAMFYRLGSIPPIPVVGDEIAINDPAIALSRGRGLIAPSFVDSSVGLDKLYAHFPPVYIYLQAAIFRVLGVSGYSLRLLTTVMSIAAAAVFVLIIDRLYRWNLVERWTGLLVACLYTLSLPVIILHRMSRMESLIECLSLISLYCILRVVFRIPEQIEGNERKKQRDRVAIGWMLMGSLMAGLCLATHPEAFIAVLPIGLLILLAARIISLGQRIAALAVMALTPLGIWIITYGRHWKAALYQMHEIARYSAPEPSFSRFGLTLLRNSTSSQHDFMVFFFFVLTVSAMLLVMVRAMGAWLGPKAASDPISRSKVAMYMAFSIAIPLTFVILIFLLPSGITRYEVIYPEYLVIIAISPLVRSGWHRIYMPLGIAVGGLILAQFAGGIVYLTRGTLSKDVLASRYDALLNCIPAGPHVAASREFWFAFERKDRPFTLLYPRLDGLDLWKHEFVEPLQSFDVILLSDDIKGELDPYAPLSEPGRVEQDVRLGSRVLRVYSRVKWPDRACLAKGQLLP